jgi:hypothetical protein
MHTFLTLAADAAPAGGAELSQVVVATAAVTFLTAVLAALGLLHRAGRVQVLERASIALGRHTGLPGWAALPASLAGFSLLTAALGMYWDIALHIDQGRDAGPLANPAHYFILLGLYGILAAGWFAIVLPREGDAQSPAALRLGDGWSIPVGGVLLTACASFAMIGFPLDDVSHRLFGQDVTLWGPTHLMLLGGAALTLVGILVLITEGHLASRPASGSGSGEPSRLADRLRHSRVIGACGGLLIGLSIFQAEFDFGVPQFRLLFHPVLIAFAAALGLVVARTVLGRGGALAVVAFYLVVRGGLSLLTGPVLGEATPHFPLYVVEALLVEMLAWRMRPGTFRFGAAVGLLIGTVGVVAEWGWSHAWMPLPWPGHLLVSAIALSVPVAIAGGTLGTFAGAALRLNAELVGRPRAWAAAGASLLVVAAVAGALLQVSSPDARAQIALRTIQAAEDGGPRTVAATIRFEPASAVADADWLTITAWQGGAPLVVDRLRALGDGVYASTRPIPVSGDWKAMIRFQRDADLAAIPIAMPADDAIPVGAIPPLASATRDFQLDLHVLQRERKQDVPGWLWGVAGLVVLGCTSVLLLVLGWGLVRLARRGSGVEPREPEPAGATAKAAPPAREPQLG